VATFEHAKLDWNSVQQAPHDAQLALYRQVLGIRQREIVPRLAGISGEQAYFQLLGKQGLQVNWILGDGTVLTLLGNFSDAPMEGLEPPACDMLYASSSELENSLAEHRLPPWSVAWFLEVR